IMEYENKESDFASGLPDKLRDECYEQGEKLYHHLVNALEAGIKEGVIRSELDIVQTAHILWACTVGIFTTTRKKANYMRLYHGSDPEKIIAEAFDMLLCAIKS
ncbi:MAG: TetR/AcrR family transcriptional regulator, partial [Gorillibacterium sp.]|nr:TetR/AcrR family transcriptional regulator [Gorillibacterium sp.]